MNKTGRLVVHLILIAGALLMVGLHMDDLTSFMSLGESTRVPR